jgi:hypothetical protein
MLIIKATIILIGPAQLHMNIVVHAPPAYDLWLSTYNFYFIKHAIKIIIIRFWLLG